MGDGQGMHNPDFKREIDRYGARDLEQRKNWYSLAAVAYDQVRPRYPQALLGQVAMAAQLSARSRILEVGCGPATATVDFAKLGCWILGLEPNPDFFALAQRNCQVFSNVTLQNLAFEEWLQEFRRSEQGSQMPNQEISQFDAVLAASSFHWIPATVGYPQAARLLKKNGRLILLWNKELQPSESVYRGLSEIYQVHTPELDRYETREQRQQILQELGQMAIDSGYFQDLVTGQIDVEVTYTVDQYLTLLNTYSPYLKLDPVRKTALFTALRERIEVDWGGSLALSYISAFHITQKCSIVTAD
ncbi:class I SAM-dependent methyltransferase [Alkalinema pantanalense CENA528]|uniref:class I SAM-dependent methyltransferase n=1 Tax=Alkalinema pantanalense TaxID=1620705 RepID=UPI003D6FEB27